MKTLPRRTLARHDLRTPHARITVQMRTCSVQSYGEDAGRPATWGMRSEHTHACWEVHSSASARLRTCRDPREARAAIEAEIRYARVQAGDDACRRLWDRLCAQQAALGREHRRATTTAATLLRLPHGRAAVRELDGRTYSARTDDLATRRVVAEALALLRSRAARREARKVAEAARRGPEPGRFARLAADRRRPGNLATRLREGLAALATRLREGLAAGKYTPGRVRRELKRRPDALAPFAEGSIESLVSLVGTIGEQARDDSRREFGTGVGRDRYRPGKSHYFEAANLHSVQVLPDWTAALVTMRDFVSFGRGNSHGGRGHDTTRGVSFRCYLVVRDTTTKEAHILRVPPKFGNDGTKFYGTFRSDAERVKAAVAWSFRLEPAEYAPAVEA